MNDAWRCVEEFTPDGKKLVRRERSVSDTVVRGAVAVIVVLAVVLLALTGHALLSAPAAAGVGGFWKWFWRHL